MADKEEMAELVRTQAKYNWATIGGFVGALWADRKINEHMAAWRQHRKDVAAGITGNTDNGFSIMTILVIIAIIAAVYFLFTRGG